MVIDIAVKTIDRSPKKNFLGQTVRNLERAGVFDSEHLGEFTIVDGGSPSVARFFKSEEVQHCAFDAGRRTMHQNARRCIEIASSRKADFALVLEDDIDVVDGFLEQVVAWINDHKVWGPMMYVFGAAYGQIRAVVEKGGTYWPYAPDDFYGALACAWSRETAQDIVKWLGPDPFYLNKSGREDRDHGHDLMLGRWGKERDVTFLASAPCFVQHIGVDSTLNNKMVTYTSWFGRDYLYTGTKNVRVITGRLEDGIADRFLHEAI